LSDDDHDDDSARVRLPSLDEFIERAQREFEVLPFGVGIDDGTVELRFLVRDLPGGKRCRAGVDGIARDQPMAAETLARLCRALRIPE
jgi:hypothetical protein